MTQSLQSDCANFLPPIIASVSPSAWPVDQGIFYNLRNCITYHFRTILVSILILWEARIERFD